LLHTDKCDGISNKRGNGVGNNMAGDKVGDGEGNKGNRHLAWAMVMEAMATATRMAGKQWRWQQHKQWQ
jgi:hypothetical protein